MSIPTKRKHGFAMTRRFWVLAHRYAGLYIASFLIVAGLTGCLLAFNSEIDEWLNPQSYKVPLQDGPMLDPLALRERALALVPQGRINSVELDCKPGGVYTVWFEPRKDPLTEQPLKLGFSSLRLNPYTGAEIERVKDGIWPLTRKTLMGFVYELHYSMAVGEIGRWLFGIAAIIWTVDCFVGFCLTLPRPAAAGDGPRAKWWKRWLPAWAFVLRGEPYRINFNLHRAAGLWVWPMLLVFAWSAVAFNLRNEVYTPVMKTLFGMKDTVDDLPKLPAPQADPGLAWPEAYRLARACMAEQSQKCRFVVQREKYLSYDADKGVFYYTVASNRDVPTKFGGTTVAFDGMRGAFLGVSFPTGENAAYTFTSWIGALHMAAVWGLPLQIFVSLMGLVVTMLSITGVYLWWKRRHTAAALGAAAEASLSQ
jgi:uncharacterized iron-regulated membrane protein